MMPRTTHGWAMSRPNTRFAYGAHRRIRKRVLAAEPTCQQCGEAPSKFADHVVPVCLGGATHPENYQALCRDCSLSKTGREGAMMRNAKRRSRKRERGQ
jgi:5-methylcytosine-specific restriction endonuclease McrA